MRFIRCDRCEKEIGMADMLIDSMFDEPSEWMRLERYDLCPACARAFREFMGEEIAPAEDPAQTRVEDFARPEGDATVTDGEMVL